ncbi:nucleoside diphosphate kinase 6-like isoform X2, partial [Biomphalaria pfeifferi]
GPLWTYILCGDNAISRWRKLMGPTKVLKTVYDEPLSIRGLYGLTDTRNCTHGS